MISAFFMLALTFSVTGQPADIEPAPFASPLPESLLPTSLDLEPIRAMPVQHGGRWPPLDTVSRRVVPEITEGTLLKDHDPVLVFLAWSLDPETWRRQPLIEIANRELRLALELPKDKTIFSYDDLVSHDPLMSLIRNMAPNDPKHKGDPLQSKVRDLNARLTLLHDTLRGDLIRPVPHTKHINGAWLSISDAILHDEKSAMPVVNAWLALRTAFLADDPAAFTTASEMLLSTLAALPSAKPSNPGLIQTELRYNRLQPFHTAWQVMVAGAILAIIAAWVRRRWCDVLAALVMLAGFAILTYGLVMRWQIAGRLPAANMFESLLFLSWGIGAFAIFAIFVFPNRIIPITSAAMGALSLFLADSLLDSHIKPVAAVLMDTYWMSIHVPVIMISYSVLALGVCFAHLQLFLSAFHPRRSDWIRTIDTLHLWHIRVGTILLMAGIATGSMWAASSWGRYWGWDPKEVWSLIAFLGYLTIVHVRVDRSRIPRWGIILGMVLLAGMLSIIVPLLAPITPIRGLALAGTVMAVLIFVFARGRLATAIKSILAFWLIVMTYLGVNFVLSGGLHSYGFGTGAVVYYMFLTGGIDLAFVAVCTLVFALRRGQRESCPTVPA